MHRNLKLTGSANFEEMVTTVSYWIRLVKVKNYDSSSSVVGSWTKKPNRIMLKKKTYLIYAIVPEHFFYKEENSKVKKARDRDIRNVLKHRSYAYVIN